MKSPVSIIAVAVIALATIAGTVILVITGHDAGSITQLITIGVSLATATGVISSKQEANTQKLNAVAASVNGNTSTLIDAAIRSNSLTAEQLAPIQAHNDTLVAPVTVAPGAPIQP